MHSFRSPGIRVPGAKGSGGELLDLSKYCPVFKYGHVLNLCHSLHLMNCGSLYSIEGQA